jgi:hypothetical protein
MRDSRRRGGYDQKSARKQLFRLLFICVRGDRAVQTKSNSVSFASKASQPCLGSNWSNQVDRSLAIKGKWAIRPPRASSDGRPPAAIEQERPRPLGVPGHRSLRGFTERRTRDPKWAGPTARSPWIGWWPTRRDYYTSLSFFQFEIFSNSKLFKTKICSNLNLFYFETI